jgi:bacillithiol biosynthesis cysteine-adding enzyme BshC
VLDADSHPRTISLPAPAGAGDVAVASVTLDESIAQAGDDLARALAPTEFSAALEARWRDAYRPGRGMVDAFGRWLEALLGPLGLVVYDSSDPAAKPLVRDLFAREIRDPGRTARLAAAAGAALSDRGYHAQVAVQEDSVALFHLDGGRRPIRRHGSDFTIGDRPQTAAAVLDAVTARPAEFSPNVLLRPIVQDTIFPTIAYVAGPNELAYLAQLRDVYRHFDVPMPLMYPRATATLVDAAASRFLSRYDVRLDALQPRDEGALNRLLESQLPDSVEASFGRTRSMLDGQMTTLIGTVAEIDPTLEGAARSTLGRMQHELQALHGKMIQAAKRRDETLRRQFTRTQALVFPNGQPQERALGFVYFLNRYGPGLVDFLRRELPLDMGRHWVLTV